MKALSNPITLFCQKAFYETNSKFFLRVNDFLSIVIVISILAIIFESVSKFSHYNQYFLVIEYTAVFIFSIEYICRIIGSHKKLSYIFSFFGLVDLISILPTLLGISNLSFFKSIRALRILRFLRMIRLAKVVRFEHLERQSAEDKSAILRLNIQIYFSALIFTITTLGTLVYVFEHGHPNFENIPLSMLWILEALLGGSISTTMPQTYAGIIIFMVARFVSFILLGFLIHIIGTAVSHLLLGKKTDRVTEDKP
ncbi:MAG: ion transporter [Patescibacteria group bacterium]